MNRITNKRTGLIAALCVAVTGVFAAPANAQEPDLALMQSFINLMQGYYQIIESTHSITSDPEKAAILQMVKLKEAYEESGQLQQAERALQETLDKARNPSIRAAAFVMLGDLQKERGDRQKAAQTFRKALEESLSRAE